VQLFETFHGREAEIVRKQVSDAMRKDYTALGDLVSIGFEDGGYSEDALAVKWDKCNRIDFTKADGTMLAASPDGKQLYVIGGNQDVSGCLKTFEGVDASKDLIDLGEVYFVVYEARKVHTDFKSTDWCHKFGSPTTTRPRLMFNRLQEQIFFVGGEYFIDTSENVSPGIEG
jgi:hypothetical protein